VSWLRVSGVVWLPCQDGGDVIDGVELSHGDIHDEFVGFVVGQGEPAAVDSVEGDGRGQGEPFVPVDEGVVSGQRVQERRGLGIKS
jgi:hypothetical protein